ncbi:lytic transglycosylase domain-containing protein [Defluviimonas sp. D31]|uniref:lytic transglycosylase domain-containing protein n=1 Tax=Defluviimonas sp. D31 TaxID=3083253 RepID=UPI00296F499F|nr:lytic transglycosylase domain-containing protein [Defluviimonas sp. D31]MDW4550224.1 lytic transglycosylase domain-containing protein [Defluviimonas sp. D31]
MIRDLVRAAPLALAMLLPLTTTARADDPAGLRAALASGASGDWAKAAAEARAAGPVTATVIEWQRLRDGEGSFGDYVDFLARHPDWPGLPLLRDKGETVIAADQDPTAVIAYFGAEPPRTGSGSLALAAALRVTGQGEAAEKEVIRAWRSLPLTDEEHKRFLAGYGKLLAKHHDGRTAAMLRAGRLADVRRMLVLNSANTRAVAEARVALQAVAPGVDGLVAKVPAAMAGSTGLAYDRFRWRIRKDLYDSASELMLDRSASAESLGDPEQWADWRRKLARREMRVGSSKRAYRMAASHHLTSGADYADLEWLAGYIALRKLGDAETALVHFDRFTKAVNGPISRARAGYWTGRAYEALGRTAEAQAAYAEGARYQTAFYGLLAAEKVGLPLAPSMAGGEPYPDWRQSRFSGSEVLQAAQLLQAAGERDLALRFLLHLGESLSGEEIGALAGLALEWKDANAALLLAKAAAEKGVVWPSAYFPTNGMEGVDLPVARELALSIARRESEFDPVVVSHAGARGLMQVMPNTAKMMAKKIGLGYDGGKLTSDWKYNARLGAAYLDELIDEFGTSPVLVAAGYNAGPGRPRGWIAELGDPRSDKVDVVDWIEHIPYRETQNYIMRVSESLPVYRARLSGQTGPLRFSEELKGR